MEVQGCLCCFSCDADWSSVALWNGSAEPASSVLLLCASRFAVHVLGVSGKPRFPVPKLDRRYLASAPLSLRCRLMHLCPRPLELVLWVNDLEACFALCGFDPASSLPINVELRRMQLHAFLSLLLYLNSLLLLAGFVLVFRLRDEQQSKASAVLVDMLGKDRLAGSDVCGGAT